MSIFGLFFLSADTYNLYSIRLFRPIHNQNDKDHGNCAGAQSKRYPRSPGVEREQIVIERNHREVARLLPGPARLTALEAMADLYRTPPEKAGADWERDSRARGFPGDRLAKGVRNPWDFRSTLAYGSTSNVVC